MPATAYLLLVLAPLFWGGNSVAGKLAADQWWPFTFTAARWLFALLVLLPFAWPHLRADCKILKRSWPFVLALGGLGLALFNLLMYLALHQTTAINVSILQASIPVLILLANFLILSQRVLAVQIVGLCVSIAGVLITVTRGQPWQFFQTGLNLGDAIMLLACVFYAGYTFCLRWRPAVHWLSFMSVMAMGAFLMCLPFAGWEWLHNAERVRPDSNGWLVLGYVVIFPTIVGQIAYARGVELIGGNRAGLFVNLVPIFGSLLAVLLIGESFRWFHALGLAMVLGGIMLAEHAAGAWREKQAQIPGSKPST